MKVKKLTIDKLTTERLILIPFTINICKNILNNDYRDLEALNLKKGNGWPDEDVLDTLPRIINNLNKVEAPTGYESWMIIKKETREIIGDAGFKGFNFVNDSIDIGYGIIDEERRNGYAEEAVTALIHWAMTNEMVKEITATCHLENINSINLLTKLSFHLLKTENKMMYWSLANKHYYKKH